MMVGQHEQRELRALRRRLGLTQKQLAEALGVSKRTVEDVEAGTSPYRPILRLAAGLATLRIALHHRDGWALLDGDLRNLIAAWSKRLQNMGDPDEHS